MSDGEVRTGTAGWSIPGAHAALFPGGGSHLERYARVLPAVEILQEVRSLGAKLGPLLVQLPPSLAFEARSARAFFETLRRLHDGEVACEPRHAGWFAP
jgi:uncharacterized protein YecE (DUF72 family)